MIIDKLQIWTIICNIIVYLKKKFLKTELLKILFMRSSYI